MKLAGLLLAAGGATRFGSPKVLAPFHGKPLVRLGVELLMPRCPAGVHVVVGASADGVRAALAGEAVKVVDNPDWASGLSTSLVSGVAALPAATQRLMEDWLTPMMGASSLGENVFVGTKGNTCFFCRMIRRIGLLCTRLPPRRGPRPQSNIFSHLRPMPETTRPEVRLKAMNVLNDLNLMIVSLLTFPLLRHASCSPAPIPE
jgi:hypothetical protein